MEPDAPRALDGEGVDGLIRSLARWIARRRLETPAVLLIEMNRPLALIGATAAHFGAPVLGPLFGERFFRDLGVLMEEPENVERLLREIEREAAERDAAARTAAADGEE